MTSYEMSHCKNCECAKVDHADGVHCLFAPTKFEAMTPTEYFVFLTRKVDVKNFMPPTPPQKPLVYVEPACVWEPYTVNIVSSSSYTLCKTLT
jgi:hypothetical protein